MIDRELLMSTGLPMLDQFYRFHRGSENRYCGHSGWPNYHGRIGVIGPTREELETYAPNVLSDLDQSIWIEDDRYRHLVHTAVTEQTDWKKLFDGHQIRMQTSQSAIPFILVLPPVSQSDQLSILANTVPSSLSGALSPSLAVAGILSNFAWSLVAAIIDDELSQPRLQPLRQHFSQAFWSGHTKHAMAPRSAFLEAIRNEAARKAENYQFKQFRPDDAAKLLLTTPRLLPRHVWARPIDEPENQDAQHFLSVVGFDTNYDVDTPIHLRRLTPDFAR